MVGNEEQASRGIANDGSGLLSLRGVVAVAFAPEDSPSPNLPLNNKALQRFADETPNRLGAFGVSGSFPESFAKRVSALNLAPSIVFGRTHRLIRRSAAGATASSSTTPAR